MPEYRIGDAAVLLGVSVDVVRRWTDEGRLRARRTEGGHRLVDGADLARLATSREGSAPATAIVGESSRNRLPGIVTRVLVDGVMAQVELRAGPHRVVSLMSREAAEELGLEPGVPAIASVKSTNVVIEVPG